MIYLLAEGVTIEESESGAFLVSLRPLRMVRLNGALLKLMRQLAAGEVCAPTPAEEKVLQSLVKSGFVHCRRQGLHVTDDLPLVSVVIPVKDRAADLRNCLSSLHALAYPQDRLQVVVVDDGSSDDTPEVAQQLGATLIHSGAVGGGPALARNRGAEVARGEIIAFIDSDCTAAENWLLELLPAFSDPEVAAVGGWVDGMHDGSPLDRYEAVMSSLNLGKREMLGGAGGDTFYLPSCNLLMRREPFIAAGGFRTELHVGEDVDLTWRLRDSGWKIQYLPCGTVFHAHRSLIWPFMKRRFDYGTSEGLLHQLHPGRGKKMFLPPLLSLILLLFVACPLFITPWPAVAAVLLLGVDALQTRRRMQVKGLQMTFGRIVGARIRAVGSLGYYIGYHLLRYYLVPLLLSAVVYPPLALVLVVLWFTVGFVDYRVKAPQISLVHFYLFYLLEQISYGMGVARGCFAVKSFASYRLDFKKVQSLA